jgi:hypothetical protein
MKENIGRMLRATSKHRIEQDTQGTGGTRTHAQKKAFRENVSGPFYYDSPMGTKKGTYKVKKTTTKKTCGCKKK